MVLAQEKCQLPLSLLSRKEADELHGQIREWTLTDRSLCRAFTFEDFHEAIDFVNDVAFVAQAHDHHPDIHISYAQVRLHLTTHRIGGLSKLDFVLAAKIDQLIA